MKKPMKRLFSLAAIMTACLLTFGNRASAETPGVTVKSTDNQWDVNVTYDNSTGEVSKAYIVKYYGSDNPTLPTSLNVNIEVDGTSTPKTVNITGISKEGDDVFDNKNVITNVSIPNCYTFIGDSVYENCIALSSVTLPNSVKSIGEYAFAGCSSLSSIALPGVIEIKGWAFRNCTSLETVNLTEELTSIADGAFSGCSSIKALELPASLSSIGGGAFKECGALKTISLPEKCVSNLGQEIFAGCTSLGSVTLPANISLIPGWTFSDAPLKSVTFGGTVEQWKKVDYGIWNDNLNTAIIHCTGGDYHKQHNVVNDAAKAATCTTAGKTAGSHCKDCKVVLKAQTTIPATGHNFSKQYTVTKPATTKANGSKCIKCTNANCKETKNVTTIRYAKTVQLSETSFVYNGKTKKPGVTLKDAKGAKIASSNYTIQNKGAKLPGRYTVTITFKGDYKGTVNLTYDILPKTPAITKISADKKGFTASWKADSTVTGYEVEYALDKNFKKSPKTVNVSKKTTVTSSVKNLKASKKYYVRMRSYVKVGSKKIYSDWSKVKTVTTKR